MNHMFVIILLPIMACTTVPPSAEDTCERVPTSFASYVQRTLTDSTDLFKGGYPPVTPLTCEVLGLLRDDLKDDSAHYHFERFARRYWSEDPHSSATHAYIRRHMNFPLAMAAVAHWYVDTRIEGLRELQEYRRMRPLVCTTKEGNALLERQDRAAVEYLLHVMERTPMYINGSENATVHQIFMRLVMQTLDLFTGQDHQTADAMDLRINRSEASVKQAVNDWRSWLNE